MFDSLKLLLSQNISGPHQGVVIDVILLAAIAVTAVAGYFAAKGLLNILDRIVRKTPTEWDDDLLNRRFIRGMAQLAPALLISWLLPNFFDDRLAIHHWAKILTSFYIVWAVVHIVNVTLSNLYNALARRPRMKSYAVKGVFQMGKLISIALGVIVGLSILIGKTPLAIITAVGASAAVLMLVFRDTILGLVASVQLTANEMVHRGDWITAPKYDVNGEVIDVSLTTVKVRNWDNSISTIPPYSLVSDSFRNYQAMRDSGGRRVERSVLIDMNTVRFLSDKERAELTEEGFLEGVEMPEGARIINLGLLRRHLERYLNESPLVNHEMTCMVREMEPTPTGVPLQVYFFTREVEWTAYESIQSDFMDYLYAVVRRFGLSVFQSPAGSDILALGKKKPQPC